MQYIATLNYLCTRSNGDLCTQILDVCRTPMTRSELGILFKDKADSSKMSRVLFMLQDVGLINQIDNKWQADSRVANGVDGLPFRVVPVNGINGEILRLFGAQHRRFRSPRPPAGGFRDVHGPKANLTIKSISVVLSVSREVLQLRLTELVRLGLLTRTTSKRPYTYELSLRNDK